MDDGNLKSQITQTLTEIYSPFGSFLVTIQALSFACLAKNLFTIGVEGVVSDIIDGYDEINSKISDLIETFVSVPDEYGSLVVISLISSSAWFQMVALAGNKLRSPEEEEEKHLSIWIIVAQALFGLTLLGLIFIPMMIYALDAGPRIRTAILRRGEGVDDGEVQDMVRIGRTLSLKYFVRLLTSALLAAAFLGAGLL